MIIKLKTKDLPLIMLVPLPEIACILHHLPAKSHISSSTQLRGESTVPFPPSSARGDMSLAETFHCASCLAPLPFWAYIRSTSGHALMLLEAEFMFDSSSKTQTSLAHKWELHKGVTGLNLNLGPLGPLFRSDSEMQNAQEWCRVNYIHEILLSIAWNHDSETLSA